MVLKELLTLDRAVAGVRACRLTYRRSFEIQSGVQGCWCRGACSRGSHARARPASSSAGSAGCDPSLYLQSLIERAMISARSVRIAGPSVGRMSADPWRRSAGRWPSLPLYLLAPGLQPERLSRSQTTADWVSRDLARQRSRRPVRRSPSASSTRPSRDASPTSHLLLDNRLRGTRPGRSNAGSLASAPLRASTSMANRLRSLAGPSSSGHPEFPRDLTTKKPKRSAAASSIRERNANDMRARVMPRPATPDCPQLIRR